ncbi:MAG: ATP-dependent Clp protease ATP-binding subunit [Acidobacteria bacterium]|nr:ATP-dependent Clp protease ATP-binding subunit [Acidobacteriota bacterium]
MAKTQSAREYPQLLNPDQKCTRAQDFEEKLMSRVIGQDRAVRKIVELYQVHLAGFSQTGRPIGNLLLLGPTGTGKTRLVEAAAEILFGDTDAMIRIDCAEMQHSHEIAKLIGSPPGYLGHRETTPLLTQERLEMFHTEFDKFTFVLFDEIEKASDALWQLLLGIMDKGSLTLGDNRRVDFSKTIIVLTSNLGAREMSEMVTGGVGFGSFTPQKNSDDLDQKLYRVAIEAARRQFSPEFMNRIDKTVVFRSLKQNYLQQILELEIKQVQKRILHGQSPNFLFQCSSAAQTFLLDEGFDSKYGARHLKRGIERFLVSPLANLVANGQIQACDLINIDLDPHRNKLTFAREEGGLSWEQVPQEYAVFFTHPTGSHSTESETLPICA